MVYVAAKKIRLLGKDYKYQFSFPLLKNLENSQRKRRFIKLSDVSLPGKLLGNIQFSNFAHLFIANFLSDLIKKFSFSAHAHFKYDVINRNSFYKLLNESVRLR